MKSHKEVLVAVSRRGLMKFSGAGPIAKIKVRAKVTAGIRPDTLCVDHGTVPPCQRA
jgi:anaerobic selenocysteine-containing dehydrogenase